MYIKCFHNEFNFVKFWYSYDTIFSILTVIIIQTLIIQRLYTFDTNKFYEIKVSRLHFIIHIYRNKQSNRRRIILLSYTLKSSLFYIFYFLIAYGVCKNRKYCNRMSEKKSLLLTNVHVLYDLEDKKSKKKFRLSVWMSVRTYVRGLFMWTQWKAVSGSKQNLVGVFYVWNVGLVLKSKVISWFWSWFWTEFWFSQKLCGAPSNLVDIFSI